MFLHREIEAAIEALYDWVGERRDIFQKTAMESHSSWGQHYIDGEINVCTDMLWKMRTLFSGLIDFEQTEEKQKNGL